MSLDPITAISDLLTKIVGGVTNFAEAKNEIAKMRESGELQTQLTNLQINLADAQSANRFQSSWRPALAWSCVLVFVYHYLLFNFLALGLPTLKDIATGDLQIMMGVLTILIGARTMDKWQGTDTK